MMGLLERLLGPAIILSVVGATAYSIWSSTRARGRLLEGVCTRCGRPDPMVTLPDGERMVRMCPACAATTTRHHRAGYAFFLIAGILAALVVAVGVAADLAAGRRLPPEALELLIPVVMPLGAAWWIRRRMSKEDD